MLTDLPLLVAVPALVGLVTVVAGVILAVHRARRRRQWTRTRGTVTGWRHTMTGAENGGISVPEVSFRTADGREVTASLPYGVNVGIYPTGGEVDVWYDPADPQRVQANVMGTGCLPYFLMVLGIAIGVVGYVVAYGF